MHISQIVCKEELGKNLFWQFSLHQLQSTTQSSVLHHRCYLLLYILLYIASPAIYSVSCQGRYKNALFGLKYDWVWYISSPAKREQYMTSRFIGDETTKVIWDLKIAKNTSKEMKRLQRCPDVILQPAKQVTPATFPLEQPWLSLKRLNCVSSKGPEGGWFVMIRGGVSSMDDPYVC